MTDKKRAEPYLNTIFVLGDDCGSPWKENKKTEVKLAHADKSFGDKLELNEFLELVKTNCLADNDGWGYAGYKNYESNIMVSPSEAMQVERKIDSMNRYLFTHIYWYNA